MKTIKYRRTSEIKLTNEARLLKELRVQSGLSLREVGRKLERSECFVRHIEKGRLDVPKKNVLRVILSLYGVTYMQFSKRAQNYNSLSSRDEIIERIRALENSKLNLLKSFLDAVSWRDY